MKRKKIGNIKAIPSDDFSTEQKERRTCPLKNVKKWRL